MHRDFAQRLAAARPGHAFAALQLPKLAPCTAHTSKPSLLLQELAGAQSSSAPGVRADVQPRRAARGIAVKDQRFGIAVHHRPRPVQAVRGHGVQPYQAASPSSRFKRTATTSDLQPGYLPPLCHGATAPQDPDHDARIPSQLPDSTRTCSTPRAVARAIAGCASCSACWAWLLLALLFVSVFVGIAMLAGRHAVAAVGSTRRSRRARHPRANSIDGDFRVVGKWRNCPSHAELGEAG